MLALKSTCLHPTSQKPYVKSLLGGRDNSPEGLQKGITHAFVVEFDNEKDRDYYAKEDPVHRKFVESLGGMVNAQVVDIRPGVF